VLIASLIVGTVLGHFGITTDQLVKTAGLSPDHIEDLARQGVAWALPNLLLGALVIVPVWFVLTCSGRRARAGIDQARDGAPLAALSLVRSDAAMTTMPTTAIMMVQTAFISGLTPRRTSE
jgi:hypothetical protein